VWRILLHHHPVHIDDPSATCGHIARQHVAEFSEAILDYPDYLQDTLWVIAHANGLDAAMLALDAAIREHLDLKAGDLAGDAAAPAAGKR
jgi:hypothetical protein